ncbi:hypothetical protein AQUCO_00600403v1 [Aquilegia coerulea]|uniref:F-box domain-containing protein n=1 Tax=Aquilegia coerulea TaxID=218851 RepID=A0A2G5EPV9_AQUCA|nr:hypothetical protein AQUCO_00600403v1 [Aquilegia coerulea]
MHECRQGGSRSVTAKLLLRNNNILIPEDLVIEILLWLPVKSLVRFRCVCKFWEHLLTTNLNFTGLYYDRQF